MLIGVFCYSQKSNGGYPLSFHKIDLQENIDNVIVNPPSISNLQFEDSVREVNNQFYRVGLVLPLNLNISNFGTWDELADGTKIWRLKISSQGAKSLTVLYDNFHLTPGSKLYLYNENKKQVLGYYDYKTNPVNTNSFSTQMIEGESVYLELNLASDCTELPILNISGIVYNYRAVNDLIQYYSNNTKETGFGASGGCHPNINCPEGNYWQDEKKGIALIFVIDGMAAGFCNGSLVNNTAFDGTPYFLTAEHCGGSVSASDMTQWQFYFNFEADGCENPTVSPSYETVIGAEFRSKGPMNDGTDFLLLELLTTPEYLSSIDTYYNGWDRSEIAATSGVLISHPSGDIKKISTFTETLTISTYTGCLFETHWKAFWQPTESGYGCTEGGASGAPLLSQDHLIVGTLTGGASYCDAPTSSMWDCFGKFDSHWITNGTIDNLRLKPWLDPDNTGSFTCPGFYPQSSFGMVQGHVFNDLDQNCNIDNFEHGLGNYIIEINPGNITLMTNAYGAYYIDSLPVGNYTVTVDTTNLNWSPTCETTQDFEVINSQAVTLAPNFGFYSNQPCADPTISIYAPILRRCFDYQDLFILIQNQYTASDYLENAYVILELDDLITINDANYTFISLGDSRYQFEIGDVGPGQLITCELHVEVSCDAVLDQIVCMKAELYPIQDCFLDTIPNLPGGAIGDISECDLPWDHSSLNVEGWCQNDSVYFLITNTGDTGEGNMLCESPVRIYIDGVLTQVESIQLEGQQTYLYDFEATGQTWRLEVDQHPLHPGNSYPNAVVELCGDLENWIPGFGDAQYQDDADPFIDIFCEQIIGSWDPNDKAVSPSGLSEFGYINPNQMLEYKIRFQNTGSDTAFTVVVKDTLDFNLNIFTVVPGVTSHLYDFNIESGHVLVWTFNDILLVDSTTNEPDSHGFLTFKIAQNPNLPYDTQILNNAEIYFDYNEPVITNEVISTIYDFNPLLLSQNLFVENNNIKLFPNPAKTELNIKFDLEKFKNGGCFRIIDLSGRVLLKEHFNGLNTSHVLKIENFNSGMYILITNSENNIYTNKFIVK
jgi:uncharacterized repeat protein (TIGR01451 family)